MNAPKDIDDRGTERDDSVLFGLDTATGEVKSKSDFSLLSPTDLVAVSKTPTSDVTPVQVDRGTRNVVSGSPSPNSADHAPMFQPTPHMQSDTIILPRLGNFFQFREKIGVGGFCDIHKAFDVTMNRDVAIKTLHKDSNDKYSSRFAFITEAKVTAQLDHPNIIPIHGMYTDDENRLHLVMKLIEGMSLKEMLQRQTTTYKNMPPEEVKKEEHARLVSRLEIFLKICDAISYAHVRKILHRDLKPENIMIGQYNEVYVMDWGIAESRDANARYKDKTVLGTPQYLAPEIVANQPYDSRSDIYSLGVILFNIVYLKQPYPPKTKTEELCKMKMSGQTAVMKHSFGIRVPRTLNHIVRKAMNRQPAARYQTVQSLADDLHRFLRGEQVVESILGHVRRFFSSLLRS